MNIKIFFRNLVLCGLMLITLVAPVSAEREINDSGIQHFYDGDYEQAKVYFLEDLSKAELKDQALIYLSRIALETGDTDKALERIEQALEVAPNNIEAVILSADIYCQHAQNSSIFKALRIARKCISQYESAIERDSNNIEALMAAARFHLHAPSVAGGSTKRGEEFMTQLRKVSPEHGAIVNIDWHEKDENRSAAMAIANQLVEKGFQFSKNQYEVAKYYKNIMDYEKARPLFEDLMVREKTRANQWIVNDSLLQLGEVYLAEGDNLAKGVELIEAYKRVNSNPHDVHYFWSIWSLAKAYRSMGQREKYQELVSDIQSQDYSRDKAFAKKFEDDLKKH